MALVSQDASPDVQDKLLLANIISWGTSAALFCYEAMLKDGACQKFDLPAVTLQLGFTGAALYARGN
jgi:hypothetical protein